jgi:hypothetical protein
MMATNEPVTPRLPGEVYLSNHCVAKVLSIAGSRWGENIFWKFAKTISPRRITTDSGARKPKIYLLKFKDTQALICLLEQGKGVGVRR